jgi:hypothetical protein
MFRNYASRPPQAPDQPPQAPNQQDTFVLLESPPDQVRDLLEFYWWNGDRALGVFARGRESLLWDHLIYAYMVENTRIYDVIERVLHAFRHGELLSHPQQMATYRWIETTEELFYKDASPYQYRSQVSRVRPDIRASRRNAYFRMFGMDLNHGGEGGPYPYAKAEASNRSFVATLEEFLRLVWIGIENAGNTSGADPTDQAAVQDLAVRLYDMLNTRRGPGPLRATLAREEFDYVATMSWLHLTVLFNTPLMQDLQITGTSPEERLRAMGDRVGLPAHAHSHSYFILAPALSTLLLMIEAGVFNVQTNVPGLYLLGPVRDMIMVIVTQWSRVTGRDLKAPSVALTSRSRAVQMLDRAPAAPPSPTGPASLPTQQFTPAPAPVPNGKPLQSVH